MMTEPTEEAAWQAIVDLFERMVKLEETHGDSFADCIDWERLEDEHGDEIREARVAGRWLSGLIDD